MIGRDKSSKKNDLSTTDIRFLILWVFIISALISGVAYYTFTINTDNKIFDLTEDQQRMSPNSTEPGLTKADLTLPPGANPIIIKTGIYLERIVDVNIKDNTWTAYFYIWFKWNGESINPGENFKIVDGDIESKENVAEYVNGTEHYQCYLVKAKMTKFFDVLRFPCDDHLLNINVEDDEKPRYQLLFVPDTLNYNISSRVQIPGYKINKIALVEKPHTYKTTWNDPLINMESQSTFSQLRFGIWIFRPDLGLYFKLFLGLFGAVTISILSLLIPIDRNPRFGIPAAAFFSAVANLIFISNLMPKISALALTDMITGVGMGFILLTLVEAIISRKLYGKGKEVLWPRFDQVSFIIFLAGYIVINIVIVISVWS